MNNLIIGMGEVGNGLFSVLSSKVLVQTRDIESGLIGHKIDALHICFPYSDKFSKQVKNYIKVYSPDFTIVYSTVPIGTCEKLGVVHSPVEGKHPSLGLSIQNSPRWLGSSNQGQLDKAIRLWKKFTYIREMPSADYTEWLKLRSTTKYGINLVWTDYEAEVSEKLGMDYSAIKQFDMDYNQLYSKLGMKQFQRYILDPPEGKIGGHCIVPNARLLNEQYPNDWVNKIAKYE